MIFKKLLKATIFFLFFLLFPWRAYGEEQIKIAVIFARTGEAALEGLDYYLATYLAVEEINISGGILGKPLEIIEFDNKSTPLGSRQAALKAVESKVTAVIGAGWSSHSLAMAPVLQKAGIPMITPVSTNPKITKIGDYIFRVCFTDQLQGKAMAKFARQDLKAQTAVVLKNVNSDYSIGLAESFKDASLKRGIKILWEGRYEEEDTDFTEVINKTRSLKPDVVFVPGHDKDAGLLIKQAREIGITATFLGGDGWSNRIYTFSGKAIENNYYTSLWHPAVSYPKGKQIQKDYLRKYGKKILNDQPSAYDAVMLLADAIERAQSLDKEKIRDALAATENYMGATGSISFDDNGDPVNKDVIIVKFEKGTNTFIKAIKP